MDDVPKLDHGEQAGALLMDSMEQVHPGLKLCGQPRNELYRAEGALLSCVWSLLRGASPKPVKASPEEWLKLLHMLSPHWLIPLLYGKTAALPEELWPPESVMRVMRSSFLDARAGDLWLQQQLAEIFEAFDSRGIETLVLRGAALGHQAYPDPALRPGCDLDLLVLPQEVPRAREVLEALDYRCLAKRYEVAKDFFRDENFVHRHDPTRKRVVDLHWSQWELHPFWEGTQDEALERLFQRAVRINTSVVSFDALHPVDALVHAAIHLGVIHNRDIRLIWVCDIAQLAESLRQSEDWEALQQRSVLWRGRLALEACLRMAQLWCGLRLPKGIEEYSTWPEPTPEEAVVWAHAFRDHWATLLVRPCLTGSLGLRRALSSWLHVLFPDPEIVRHCYPPSHNWLLPWSYLKRWDTWFRELVTSRILPQAKRSALSEG